VKYLLHAPQQRELQAFLRRKKTLIALDYDGTLAPIAPHPSEARMLESTRKVLAQVARRFPVIVLTGRSRIDALQFLAATPVLEVIGSHGIETPGTGTTRFISRVGAWRAQLLRRLGALAGVSIEDKRYSLSVHYRHSTDPLVAQELINEAVGELEGARIVGGKQVVNVVPENAPDKGTALLAACARLGCEQAIFVGDDDTDESAFAVGRPGQVFGIRVGQSPDSLAKHYLRSQDEIDSLLSLLLASSGSGTARPREPTPPET
jgi:trehalose 6-phosphate phosphatase